MNNCDEDRSVFNGHYEVDVLIDRPVAQVWKQFLDLGSWVTSHDFEAVSGAPGAVGAITRVSFRKADELHYPPAHHHYCKIVKAIPEQQYVLKTYSEKGGSYGLAITGFDYARFVPLDGKTKVIFNLFLEMRSEAVATDATAMNAVMDDSRQGMLTNLNMLKRIVEGR